jgi:hypothetical protein
MGKVYTRKDNAIRAAIKLGLTEESVYRCQGGWMFVHPGTEGATIAYAINDGTNSAGEPAGGIDTTDETPFSELISTDAEIAAAKAELAAKDAARGTPAEMPGLSTALDGMMNPKAKKARKTPEKTAKAPKKAAKAPKAAKTAPKAPKAPKAKAPKKAPAVAVSTGKGRGKNPEAVAKFLELVTRPDGATFAEIFDAIGDKERRWLRGAADENGYVLELVKDGRAAGHYVARPK